MNRFNEVVALARGQETPNARRRAGAKEWLCGNVGADATIASPASPRVRTPRRSSTP